MNFVNLIFVVIVVITAAMVAKFIYTKAIQQQMKQAREFASFGYNGRPGSDKPTLDAHDKMLAIVVAIGAFIAIVTITMAISLLFV